MSQQQPDGWVKRSCDYLGRQNVFSGFLDWIGRWLVPPPAVPAFGDMGPLPLDPERDRRESADQPEPLPWMFANSTADQEHSRGDVALGGTAWKAPQTPNSPHNTPNECAPARYHGMHGMPCKYAPSGTDTLCPYGAVAGWFWKYEVVGTVYYYVDCCGLKVKHKVWCNWSKEANWCALGTAGANQIFDYTCTLSLERGQFQVQTDSNGVQGISGVEQIGPPAGP